MNRLDCGDIGGWEVQVSRSGERGLGAPLLIGRIGVGVAGGMPGELFDCGGQLVTLVAWSFARAGYQPLGVTGQLVCRR